MKPEKPKTVIANFILLNTLILLFFTSCMSWDTNKVIDGIEFSKIRYETSGNDTISIIGFLKAKQNIEGYLCDEDWVHFTREWKIKMFKLSEESIVNNYKYPKGSWIIFDSDHNVICVFPTNTIVQGYLCKGDGSVMGISTKFYKSGKLQSFYSENEVTIGKVHCTGGVHNGIELFENGNLKECTLSRNAEINGKTILKGARIRLDENGNAINASK